MKTIFFPSCTTHPNKSPSRAVSHSASFSITKTRNTINAFPGSRKSFSSSWKPLSFAYSSSLTKNTSSPPTIRNAVCLCLANLAITADCCATLCEGGLLPVICDDALRSLAAETPIIRASLSISFTHLTQRGGFEAVSGAGEGRFAARRSVRAHGGEAAACVAGESLRARRVCAGGRWTMA